MLIRIFIFILGSAIFVQAQTLSTTIDSLARNFNCKECKDLKQFTKALVNPYTDAQDKARAIFAWIATHIRYDYKEAQKLDKKIRFTGTSAAEVERKKKAYFEEEIPNVTFRTRKGICQDYSYLFKQMCTAVGVESQVISGLSKDDSKQVSKVGHAWNAVKLEGKWYLLDATWAAGYINEKKFVKEYAPGYYLTDPQLFALNHLPDSSKWQMLEHHLTLGEFKKQPWVDYGQNSFPIEKALPLDAPLRKKNDTVQILIKFKHRPTALVVLGRSKRPISFNETTVDGFTLLEFNPKPNAEIKILGGKSKKGEFTRLAKFYVE